MLGSYPAAARLTRGLGRPLHCRADSTGADDTTRPSGSAPAQRAPAARGRESVAGCSSSTRRTSRSTSARCAARRCCCSRRRPRSRARRAGSCTPSTTTLPRPVVIRLVTYVQRPARHAPAQDHPPRRVRPRRLDLPVLRRRAEPDRRPRDPALQGRRLELGEHRRLVRAVQPPQGRPAAAPGRHAPAREPRTPSPHVFIHVAAPTIPAAWRQYLPAPQSGLADACSRSASRRPPVNDEGRRRRGALRTRWT